MTSISQTESATALPISRFRGERRRCTGTGDCATESSAKRSGVQLRPTARGPTGNLASVSPGDPPRALRGGLVVQDLWQLLQHRDDGGGGAGRCRARRMPRPQWAMHVMSCGDWALGQGFVFLVDMGFSFSKSVKAPPLRPPSVSP